MKPLKFFGEILKVPYIEEFQNRLDAFEVAIKLLGCEKINSGVSESMYVYEIVYIECVCSVYKVEIEIRTYEKTLKDATFKIYGVSSGAKENLGLQMAYYYMSSQELEELYGVLDKTLLYIE